MQKDDEIIEELDKKYKIIQKKGGYKYAEDTILLFNYLKKSLSNGYRYREWNTSYTSI